MSDEGNFFDDNNVWLGEYVASASKVSKRDGKRTISFTVGLPTTNSQHKRWEQFDANGEGPYVQYEDSEPNTYWSYAFEEYDDGLVEETDDNVGPVYYDSNGYGPSVHQIAEEMVDNDSAGACVCYMTEGEWVSTGTLAMSNTWGGSVVAEQCKDGNCGGA